MMARALRLFRTVRPLGARQIATRGQRMVERAWWRVARTRASSERAPTLRRHVPLWRNDEPAPRAHEVMAGRLTFLGETRDAGHWNAPGSSRLWRFHLHSFDYVRPLAAHADRRRGYETFRDLVSSWIEGHRYLGGDAWHPYTTSLRIVNWCEGAFAFRPALEGDVAFASTLYDSMAAQARFLTSHLETDVRGNHLLENARALMRAGFFFEGQEADRWRVRALDVLRREIPEQVLADGGHFERTPGYHVRVMEILADVAALLRENDSAISWIDEPLERMRGFLAAILPPNERLPLLKDTTHDEVRVQASAPQPSRWLAGSGYAVMRDDARGDHLIADFGRVCPDYLPAHAHADMFSFELTIAHRPVVVDSGVFEYEEGEWRRWFRSTAAHNTIEVDGGDQSEMWGSFRVGRRARVRRVQWLEQPHFTAIDGTHDGYAPLRHRRLVVAVPDARCWLILDHLEGAANRAARSRLHLHPDCEGVHARTLGDVGMSESRGWYSERFGEKRENRVLVSTCTTPAWTGWIIAADAIDDAMLETDERGCRLHATLLQRELTFDVKGESIAVTLAMR